MSKSDTMGDYWRDVKDSLKEESRERRDKNRERGIQLLDAEGIHYQTKDGNHFIIRKYKHVWDYWPTTGKWSCRRKGPTQRYSRGIHSLITHIKSKQPNDES